ncbi:MAG: hypothetical protein EXR77_00925, partial [Myxococcales bacterium]|nr:hypothetical protein [Myxococcales bacterium]
MLHATLNPDSGQGLLLATLRAAAFDAPPTDQHAAGAKLHSAFQTVVGSPQKATAAVLAMEQVLLCLATKLPDNATLLNAEAITQTFANLILQPLDAAHCQA